MKRVVREMGAAEITIVYGLTEASPAVTQTSIHDTLEHRVNTVGTPLPGLDVRIVSPESSQTLPAGLPGELLVRGHAVMKGYYKLPEETAATITRDGWLHTGDLAAQTPDGYFKITGRIKDLIIRGGENIYPREIEEYLFNMPEIRDVQVVGLPDKRFGEVVSAWIVLKQGASLTEQQVQDFCRDKISYFKIPHYVVFLDNFPTTVTGKAQKFKIRELGIKKFGLQEEAGIETA
jgi:fatty-acyl-CoA synthase